MQALRSMFLLSVLFSCTGCFAYYASYVLPVSPRTDIDDQTLKSIIIGSTTIEDILLRLGEPQEHYEAPLVFLYRWVWVRNFLLFGGSPAGLSYTATGDITEYTLHILFDEKNRVTRYKVSKVVLGDYP